MNLRRMSIGRSTRNVWRRSRGQPGRDTLRRPETRRAVEALYARLASGEIDALDVVIGRWRPGIGADVKRQRLFPFDLSAFTSLLSANPSLLNLAPDALICALAADYMHAQLCRAGLHAFAAENQARMEAMAAARKQVERQLAQLQSHQRLVRQEEITAEVIELAEGETANRVNLLG